MGTQSILRTEQVSSPLPKTQPILTKKGNTNLMTMLVDVRSNNVRAKIRIFLDDGAEISLISRRVAKALNLKINKVTPIRLSLANGMEGEVTDEVAAVHVGPPGAPPADIVHAYVVDRVADPMWQYLTKSTVDQLNENGITVQDVASIKAAQETEMDMLIGINTKYSILTDCSFRVSRCMVAIETIFGWCVGGVANSTIEKFNPRVCLVRSDEDIDLSGLWVGEAIQSPEAEIDECKLLKEVEESIEFKNNRYWVGLPFLKNPVDELDQNFKCALFRLRKEVESLHKRNQYEAYNDEIRLVSLAAMFVQLFNNCVCTI